MFSHEVCVGVNINTKRSSGNVARNWRVSYEVWAEWLSNINRIVSPSGYFASRIFKNLIKSELLCVWLTNGIASPVRRSIPASKPPFHCWLTYAYMRHSENSLWFPKFLKVGRKYLNYLFKFMHLFYLNSWSHTLFFRKYAKNRAYTKFQISWQKKESADLWNYAVPVDEQVTGDISWFDIWKNRMNRNRDMMLGTED